MVSNIASTAAQNLFNIESSDGYFQLIVTSTHNAHVLSNDATTMTQTRTSDSGSESSRLRSGDNSSESESVCHTRNARVKVTWLAGVTARAGRAFSTRPARALAARRRHHS